MIDREAAPSFNGQKVRTRIIGEIRQALTTQLEKVVERPAWLKPTNFDASPDFLAVDQKGRLLVIEAKPPESSSGIVKGPLQAVMYASLIATWIQRDPAAPDVLHEMLRQRIRVGLTRDEVASFAIDPPIVPVLVIGVGSVSHATLDHAMKFREALGGYQPASGLQVSPVEIWRLGASVKEI